jgi:hypothetical protein
VQGQLLESLGDLQRISPPETAIWSVR